VSESEKELTNKFLWGKIFQQLHPNRTGVWELLTDASCILFFHIVLQSYNTHNPDLGSVVFGDQELPGILGFTDNVDFRGYFEELSEMRLIEYYYSIDTKNHSCRIIERPMS
jgi:hypothetical protein